MKNTIVEKIPGIYVAGDIQSNKLGIELKITASIIWAIKGGNASDGIEQLAMLSHLNIKLPNKLKVSNVDKVECVTIPLEVPTYKLYHDTLYEINRRHAMAKEGKPILDYLPKIE